MSLSNSDLFDKLQEAANGDLSLVYRAITMTPEKPAKFLGEKLKTFEDVKAQIETLVREKELEAPAPAAGDR